MRSMLRDGDSLTVHALHSLRGERFDDIFEYEVVRTLPDPTSVPSGVVRRAFRKPSIALQRSLARQRVLRRDFDVAHIEMLTYQTDWFDVPRLRRRTALVSSVHDVRPHRSQWPERMERAALRRLYRKAGHLIVYHSSLALELIETFGVAEDRVHVVPHPLDATNRREAIDVDDHRPMVLLFGSLRQNKGFEVLLEALERHHRELAHLRFMIAGGGDRDVEEMIAAASANFANLDCELGHVTPERMHELFSVAEVIALPYTRFHSQSGVLADAYRYRLPLVVTDVGALGPTVRDDATGTVVPPGDADALAAALVEVASEGRESYAEVLDTAAMKHDYSSVGPRIRSIYDIAVDDHRSLS